MRTISFKRTMSKREIEEALRTQIQINNGLIKRIEALEKKNAEREKVAEMIAECVREELKK